MPDVWQCAFISYEEYHPYGTTAWQADKNGLTARAKRYRYTEKERDAWTGLSYHGARYYAPWLGRWEAADPAGMVDGPNRYAYVRGNPVSGIDRSGLGTSPAPMEDGDDAPPAGLEIRDTLKDDKNQTINKTRHTLVRPGSGVPPSLPKDSAVTFYGVNDRSLGVILVRTGANTAAGTGISANLPLVGPSLVLDAFVGPPPTGNTSLGFATVGYELGPNPLGPNPLLGNRSPHSLKLDAGLLRTLGANFESQAIGGGGQLGGWTNQTGGKTYGSAGESRLFDYTNITPMRDTGNVSVGKVGGGTTVSNTGLSVGGGATAVGVRVDGAASQVPNFVGGLFPRRAKNEVMASLGVAAGLGFSFRLHWADTDQDTVREYGFGLDLEFVTFDVAAELGVPAVQLVPNSTPGGWNPGVAP